METEQELNKKLCEVVLNRKLAEWAGLKVISTMDFKDRGELYIEFKDGDGMINFLECFTQSLDACFKWLVPKAQETNEIQILLPPGTAQRAIVIIGHNAPIEAKTPALALCKAIEKLIGDKDD